MSTEDPITHACRLLREAAQELACGVSIGDVPDWAKEPDTKAAHDECMAAADALQKMTCFDSCDMASASAQGFRDGQASQAQPVAECDTPNYCRSVVRCTAMDESRAQAKPVGGYQHALGIRTAQGWKLGGDKVPVLYTDEINGQQVCRDDVWLCTTAAFAAPQPAAQALDAWHPIETAPRDGTEILLGRAENEEIDSPGISAPGYWQEGCEDGVDYMGGDSGFVDSHHQIFSGGRSFGAESHRYAPNQPTHWMPLPAPPAAFAAKQGGANG